MPNAYFFRSLAEDQGEKAAGTSLSGMGMTGTLGRWYVLTQMDGSHIRALSDGKIGRDAKGNFEQCHGGFLDVKDHA